MPSIKNQLSCPHCFCKLEVSAVITQLSLQWIEENNKLKLSHKEQPEQEGHIKPPPPLIEHNSKE